MKKNQRGFMKGSLLAIIALIIVVGGIYLYKNKSNFDSLTTLHLQNYEKNNLIPYEQSKYYSLKYPEGWAVYEVKGQGTSINSLMVIPQEVADQHIITTNSEILDVSKAFAIAQAIRRAGQPMIELGAEFQYTSYLSPDKQENYLQSLVQRTKELKNSGEARVINFKGKPALYRAFTLTDDSERSQSVHISWFAQPDPQGRDRESAPILITISYTSSPERFSEEIFNEVAETVTVHVWQALFETTSSKKPISNITTTSSATPVDQLSPTISPKPQDSIPITITKNDLHLQNFSPFTYVDWTYRSENKGLFMGKTDYHQYNGKSHSINYSAPESQIMEYSATLIQFANTEELRKWFDEFLVDTDNTSHNQFKSVYKITDSNGVAFMWLHNNILITLRANATAQRASEFLEKALNIYINKFPVK